jgi:iron transport multicopper oxidase
LPDRQSSISTDKQAVFLAKDNSQISRTWLDAMLGAKIGSLFGLSLLALANATFVEHHWTVDWVRATVNGVQRPVIGINGKWPCPLIQANKGDRVKVVLTNNLGNQTTGLHFHGINQVSTNYMDGPSFATQCPLAPGKTMTYKFVADEPGTYWYHSHNMGQYPDGLRGPMIVHDPDDPYKDDYDEQYILTISDWYNTESIPLGVTMFNKSNTKFQPPIPNGMTVNDGLTSAYRFDKGKTYRFRIISFAALASAMITFGDHPMEVIMNDASYITKTSVSTLRIAPAQRQDVLITAGEDETENVPFLISLDVNRDYTGKDPLRWPFNTTGQLIVDPEGDKPSISVSKWQPADDLEFTANGLLPILPLATKTIQLDFDFCIDQNGIPRACFNGSPYIIQKVPTLYTAATVGDDNTDPRVYGPVHPFIIEYGDIVDIVVNNKDPAIHPFHLHGHQFQVLERPGSNAGVWPGPGLVELNLSPPSRDTVTVFANSYTRIRFQANNPGVFLFHCHIEWHVEMGLTVTIIEAPEKLREIPIPADHLESCKALGIPTTGNAGGNAKDHFDTSHYQLEPPVTYTGAQYFPARKAMVRRSMRGVPYSSLA